ncbi:PREDICTED: G patch domain-containing protein 4 [Charadrius vociferus]|uniref:G patch domain-containing protein 4 n=1 Tax=Charadrius vociferus TaxID=50402 RepID=UPI0005214C96|nr:PREDICTED: G patch domain-containing protein 4 [Charadrius vociferus]
MCPVAAALIMGVRADMDSGKAHNFCLCCEEGGTVGHDAAETFSFHWWDHVFNEAAGNIAVESGQDGISMKTLSEQGVRISNKKPRKAGRTGSMLYGRFVKEARLGYPIHAMRQWGGLTDEELMRACGGRTAHKGARHGLTMSAKLARLEEQERAFLATYRHKERQQHPESSPPAGRQEKRKKKKRKQFRDGADPEVLQSQAPSGEEEVEPSAVAQLRVRCLGMPGRDWLVRSCNELYFTP